MPTSPVPFDLTQDEREDVQLVRAEVDLHPERLTALLAELVLLREIRTWAMAHRGYFPPALRAKIIALGQRSFFRWVVADSRAELEQHDG